MNNFTIDLQEANQILLPDRYAKKFETAYQEITGKEVPQTQGRKASVTSGGIVFRRIRGRDIPSAVRWSAQRNPGLRVVGITGSEWFMNYMLGEQGLPSVAAQEATTDLIGTVALLSKPGQLSEIANKQLPVVTAYEFLVPLLAKNNNLNITPSVVVSGSAENIADDLNMCAVDIVDTGESAVANGFEVTELLSVYPVIVRAISRKERAALVNFNLINGITC